MIGLLQTHAPETTKPRACLESLREASNLLEVFIYARNRAFVNPKNRISSVLDRPDFVPIERSESVRMRAKPSLGHPGDDSRWTERGNFTGKPGFRPLECWHELRDNPDGLVSGKASSPLSSRVACRRTARALRENSDNKDTAGLYVKCLSHYRFLLTGRGE